MFCVYPKAFCRPRIGTANIRKETIPTKFLTFPPLILPHVQGYIEYLFLDALGFEEGVLACEVVRDGAVVYVVLTGDEPGEHVAVECILPVGQMHEVLTAVGFFLGKEHPHGPGIHGYPE